MDSSALLVLHRYNDYANRLVLDAAASLSRDDLSRRSSPSHGSVLGLLDHMLGTETHFLIACQGKPVNGLSEGSPTLAGLRKDFEKVAAERESFLTNASAEELLEAVEVRIGGGNLTLPRWQLIVQALVGSIHHRGELSIVMTALGQPLPTLDPIIEFTRESGQVWPI